MKECINSVSITGVLVKNGLEVKNLSQQDESIAGDLVIRTADGSEHEVNYFAYKYKKDKNDPTGKTFTSEENGMYKGYETAIAEYKSLETNPEDADIVSVGFGTIGVQDYENKKDGRMVSYNDVKGKFINRVEPKNIETTPQVATFEVQGIVTKLQPEMKKDEPTGNGEVHLDCVGYGGNITPVKLVVPATIVEGFGKAGFYETGLAKFSGKIINTKTVETIVEQQAFGEDLTKTVTITLKRFEITGGSPQGDMYALVDDKGGDVGQEYEAAKSKRRLKLQEIKNKKQNQGGQTQQTGFTPAPNSTPNQNAPAANPFTKNPFVK